MSNKVSVLVYSRRFGSPVRKAVMVYFAERASDNGEGIWAAKGTIAQAIECGRSTVIRTINEFVSEGLLVEVGKRPCRNGSTTEYAIDLEAVAALENVHGVPERDPSQSGTRPAAGHDPSQSGTPTRPAAGPKPPLGTIREPSELLVKADACDGFEDAWAAYPRKVGKGQAKKAWAKALKKVDQRSLQEALARFIPTQQGKEKQFIPHLATWLNGERWDDTPEDASGPRTTAGLLQSAMAGNLKTIDGGLNELPRPNDRDHQMAERSTGRGFSQLRPPRAYLGGFGSG